MGLAALRDDGSESVARELLEHARRHVRLGRPAAALAALAAGGDARLRAAAAWRVAVGEEGGGEL